MEIGFELTSRWKRVRHVMEEQDIDLVVALDLSRDEVLLSTQRWLTHFVPIGFPVSVVIAREGKPQLCAPMIGAPAIDYYETYNVPIECIPGFSLNSLAQLVANHGPRRIGIVETLAFPAGLAIAIKELVPNVEFVDISQEILQLRLRKSTFELARIKQSCAIADKIWHQVKDVFKVGRRSFEILADITRLVGMEGADGGFHLILPLPFSGMPMNILADTQKIERDKRFLMEISPRYDGYYSQLTIPVTSYRNDVSAHRAHQLIVDAKVMAQPLMVPGADLTEIGREVAAFLADRGYSLTSPSLGHFCGLGLEEPRHTADQPFILAEGMTLIFHPVLADPEMRSMMRGETYQITSTGAEKLNRFDGGVLEIT
jgi:Xaa-Pro aminopeptidase